jgi:hypothetical protein
MLLKAKEKKSHAYKTQIDAENEIYEFRKGFESPKFRKKLDECGKAHCSPNWGTINAISKHPPAQSRNKSIAMSSNCQLQATKGRVSRNPNFPLLVNCICSLVKLLLR